MVIENYKPTIHENVFDVSHSSYDMDPIFHFQFLR